MTRIDPRLGLPHTPLLDPVTAMDRDLGLRLGHMEEGEAVPWVGRRDLQGLQDLRGKARVSHVLCNPEPSLLIRLIPGLCHLRDSTQRQGSLRLANAMCTPNIKAKPSKRMMYQMVARLYGFFTSLEQIRTLDGKYEPHCMQQVLGKSEARAANNYTQELALRASYEKQKAFTSRFTEGIIYMHDDRVR